MDHMMPDPDGIETLHLLRRDNDSMNKDTDVVVLTANAISGMADMYLAEGFSDYLSKPIVGEQLEKMIAKYLPDDKIQSVGKNKEIIGIDKASAMEYCGNSEEVYQIMIEEYLAQGPEYTNLLRDYYHKRDWKNYRTIVHALKNTSLLIGAKDFSEKAKKLEYAANDGKEDILLSESEDFLAEYAEIIKKLQ